VGEREEEGRESRGKEGREGEGPAPKYFGLEAPLVCVCVCVWVCVCVRVCVYICTVASPRHSKTV